MKTTGIFAALLLLAPLAIAGSYYVVFEYDVGGETLIQKEIEFMEMEAPGGYFGGNAVIKIIGDYGEVYSTTVNVPLFSSKSYTADNEPAERTMVIKDKVEFEAVLPYYEDARTVEVFDSNGTEMLSFDLPAPSQTPTPAPTSTPGPEPDSCTLGVLLLVGGLGVAFAKVGK